ncbi:group II intron reverse transcriptase/maturase [Halosquirtibacter xylanolyticus]|uniref:group II intron reverse transcriptase/maturase n=1 Tax=Halosquirtibacter xylanolyticus TaxID=3374599 RepID=UPI00374A3084|nr:group II intron reverse transcriptase/maturase [Prolixibacteraceae bacterium]
MQKISEDSYLSEGRAELENNSRAHTFNGITEAIMETTITTDNLLERVLESDNLNKAYLQVYRNKGSHGVDEMQVESLKDYLRLHREVLITELREGKYLPNPVRRVEIPKEPGKTRPLGIPTVVDRVIQQAISQVLSPIYEEQFSNYSFGFRPNKGAHTAIIACREMITSGYHYAIDMDMEKFFDTVNHSKLIEILSRTIKDGRLVSLIHKYLRAGVVVEAKFQETETGVPQGGPLSPLLSNIMLNELDHELTRRGHKFVRYADDIVILCKSKRGATRTMNSTIRFIEDTLFLKVNRDKTEVVRYNQIKFLGYSFYKTKGAVRFRLSKKTQRKVKRSLEGIVARKNSIGYDEIKSKLKSYIQGWVTYYRLADMKSFLKQVDEWLRRRIRMVIWKCWKRVRTKMKNLMKLGVSKNKAYEYANTRKKYWRISKSPILQTTITNKNLEKAGYITLSDYYQKVKS